MKKYIKFVMSKGDPITLPMQIAENLIDKDSQILKIPQEAGGWSGKIINKAHIVSTDHDINKEKVEAENERMLIPKIDETRDDKKTKKAIGKLKKNLFEKRIIK